MENRKYQHIGSSITIGWWGFAIINSRVRDNSAGIVLIPAYDAIRVVWEKIKAYEIKEINPCYSRRNNRRKITHMRRTWWISRFSASVRKRLTSLRWGRFLKSGSVLKHSFRQQTLKAKIRVVMCWCFHPKIATQKNISLPTLRNGLRDQGLINPLGPSRPKFDI